MRIALILFVILHGLIHVLGFVKAFHLSEVKQLVLPITKSFGVIWLLCALLFLALAVLLVVRNNYWWLAGIVAVAISQIIIFCFWSDAKFGTIANTIILLGCVVGFATWNFNRHYVRDVRAASLQKPYFQHTNLTEQDMEHLPEPVKRYLHYTGSVGKPKVNNFMIEFTGKIRKDEHSEWMPFQSVQHNFMRIPTRLFFMDAEMKRLPVAGYHCYINGKAFMDIRLLSLIKVQYQQGDEMNTAETVTFFNDMCCMAPATLIDKRITWQQKDENTVMATFTNNGIAITADLLFNEQGQLVNFFSNDRYNADAGKRLPWSTPLKNYKEVNGYRLAGYADAIYTYPDKELCYGTFETLSVRYNFADENN
jgi:hypothetical protein